MLLMESSPDTGTQDSVRMTGSVEGRLSTGALLLRKENESILSRETPDTPWRRYINMYRQTSEPEFPQASLKKTEGTEGKPNRASFSFSDVYKASEETPPVKSSTVPNSCQSAKTWRSFNECL